MRFVGHACGIQPRQVNIRYSRFRGQRFQSQFLVEVEKRKSADIEAYQLILERLDIDGTIGKGADEPFTIELDVEAFLRSEDRYEAESYQKLLRLLNEGVTTTKLEPFVYELKDGKIVLTGDNDTPIGRQVNRRIEIDFYHVK